MPVSATAICNRSSGGRSRATSDTAPLAVNFSALDSRLNTICRTRAASPSTSAGHRRGRASNASPLPRACSSHIRVASRQRRRTGRTARPRSSDCPSPSWRRRGCRRPARASSRPAPCTTVSRSRVAPASVGSASITCVMPRMPLSGVRISWLVVARNSVLAASALPSAALVTARSSLAARTWSRLRRIVTSADQQQRDDRPPSRRPPSRISPLASARAARVERDAAAQLVRLQLGDLAVLVGEIEARRHQRRAGLRRELGRLVVEPLQRREMRQRLVVAAAARDRRR